MNLYSIKPNSYCYNEYIEIDVVAQNKAKALKEIEGYFESWQYPLKIKTLSETDNDKSGITSLKYLERQ